MKIIVIRINFNKLAQNFKEVKEILRYNAT